MSSVVDHLPNGGAQIADIGIESRRRLAPREIPRFWGDDDDAEFLGQRKRVSHALAAACVPVQHHQQRRRHTGLIRFRHVQRAVAQAIGNAKPTLANRNVALRGLRMRVAGCAMPDRKRLRQREKSASIHQTDTLLKVSGHVRRSRTVVSGACTSDLVGTRTAAVGRSSSGTTTTLAPSSSDGRSKSWTKPSSISGPIRS